MQLLERNGRKVINCNFYNVHCQLKNETILGLSIKDTKVLGDLCDNNPSDRFMVSLLQTLGIKTVQDNATSIILLVGERRGALESKIASLQKINKRVLWLGSGILKMIYSPFHFLPTPEV